MLQKENNAQQTSVSKIKPTQKAIMANQKANSQKRQI
jgi:hypothetical protein